MATKIRLMRMGKIRAPQYRIVVVDERAKRDGRFIELVGRYHPKQEPSLIEVDSERVQHWLSVGAQPSDPVRKILELTGDWQRHKGQPAESTVRSPAERPDRKALFEAAAKESGDEPAGGATTPKKKAKAEPEAPVAEGGSDEPGAASDQPAEA